MTTLCENVNIYLKNARCHGRFTKKLLKTLFKSAMTSTAVIVTLHHRQVNKLSCPFKKFGLRGIHT